jgi:hypothetical protein
VRRPPLRRKQECHTGALPGARGQPPETRNQHARDEQRRKGDARGGYEQYAVEETQGGADRKGLPPRCGGVEVDVDGSARMHWILRQGRVLDRRSLGQRVPSYQQFAVREADPKKKRASSRRQGRRGRPPHNNVGATSGRWHVSRASGTVSP